MSMKDSHEKLVIGKYSFYVLLLSVYIALYPLGMILYTFYGTHVHYLFNQPDLDHCHPHG